MPPLETLHSLGKVRISYDMTAKVDLLKGRGTTKAELYNIWMVQVK